MVLRPLRRASFPRRTTAPGYRCGGRAMSTDTGANFSSDYRENNRFNSYKYVHRHGIIPRWRVIMKFRLDQCNSTRYNKRSRYDYEGRSQTPRSRRRMCYVILQSRCNVEVNNDWTSREGKCAARWIFKVQDDQRASVDE